MTGGSTPPLKREPYAPRHAPKRTTASGRAAASTGPASTRAAKASTGPKKKSFLRRQWWLLLLLTPLVVMAVRRHRPLRRLRADHSCPRPLPPIQTTYLYDRNGHLLTTLHGAVDRTLVPLSQISPHMIDAVIATEDHDFYNHPGVDVGGILRAAYTDLVKREHGAGRLDASPSSS